MWCKKPIYYFSYFFELNNQMCKIPEENNQDKMLLKLPNLIFNSKISNVNKKL